LKTNEQRIQISVENVSFANLLAEIFFNVSQITVFFGKDPKKPPETFEKVVKHEKKVEEPT